MVIWIEDQDQWYFLGIFCDVYFIVFLLINRINDWFVCIDFDVQYKNVKFQVFVDIFVLEVGDVSLILSEFLKNGGGVFYELKVLFKMDDIKVSIEVDVVEFQKWIVEIFYLYCFDIVFGFYKVY